MAIGFIADNSIENILVDIVHRPGTVTDLSGSGPTFDVRDSAGALVITAASATASGMRITVPLDTSSFNPATYPAEYRLYVTFTVGAQVIKKGPYYFTIVQ